MLRILANERTLKILKELEEDSRYATKLKKIRKTLGLLQSNPRHPGLHTHKYESKRGPNGEAVWQVYVENNTASAWRIWFYYGPDSDAITILTIGPHPD